MIFLALFQIFLTPVDPGLSTPAAVMFNRTIRGLMQNKVDQLYYLSRMMIILMP